MRSFAGGCRPHTPGHLRSSNRPEFRLAIDRFQSTGDVDGQPLEPAHTAEAAADDVAAPVGTSCKPNVRSLTSRPGAAGPKARCHFSNRAAGPASQSFAGHVEKSAPFDSGKRACSDQRRDDRGCGQHDGVGRRLSMSPAAAPRCRPHAGRSAAHDAISSGAAPPQLRGAPSSSMRRR